MRRNRFDYRLLLLIARMDGEKSDGNDRPFRNENKFVVVIW